MRQDDRDPRPGSFGHETPGEAPSGLGPRRLPPAQYWSERLSGDFSLGAVGNRPLGRPFNDWAYRARLSALERGLAVHGLAPETAHILEVGFGTGYFVAYWHGRGARSITGVDITQRAVEEASRRYPGHRFAVLDIAAKDCPALGAFDIVTVFDVLFHLLDEEAFERALANTCRQIRPGGHLLLTDIFSGTESLKGMTQLSRPLPRYREILREHGLEIVGLHPVFFSMSEAPDLRHPWARWASRTYWRILGSLLERAPAAGHLIGPPLYLADRVLQRLLKDGPSVKLLVAKAGT